MNGQKTDPVIIKETCFMAIGALICASFVQTGFLIAQRWDYTVLIGGAVGWVLTVLNFFLMSRAVVRAVGDPDPHHAQLVMKVSYMGRTFLMLGVMVVSFLVPLIHWLPVVAAAFYPSVVIFVRQFWTKYVLKQPEEMPAVSGTPAEAYDGGEDGEDGFEKMVGRFARKMDTDYLKSETQKTKETEKEE